MIVVDDGSPEVFRASQLSSFAPRNTHFLRHDTNRGRAYSRNRGWREATSPLTLFLDADMYLTPESVKAHLNFHQQYPGGIAQGHIIGQSLGSLKDFFDNTYDDTRRLRESALQESVWTDASQAFFATGHVSLARHLLEQTQGFDEAFSDYGWEDLELGLRLQALGVMQQKIKTAVAYHYEPLFAVNHWLTDLEKERQRASGAQQLMQKHPQKGRWLCQGTVFDRGVSGVLRWVFPPEKSLPRLEQLQKKHPKMALALYRGLLHQYYVKSLYASQATSEYR